MGLVARLQFPTELETVLVREITTAVICLTSWRDSNDGRLLMAATGIRLIVMLPLRYWTHPGFATLTTHGDFNTGG